MAASGGIFAPVALGILRKAVGSASKLLRSTLSKSINFSPSAQVATVPLRPSPVPTGARGQPIHPSALFRQQRRLFSQWSTAASQQGLGATVRRLVSSAAGKAPRPRFDRSKFPVSSVSRAVSQLHCTPFAHTLRPNLTGGAMPRSAGGYGVTGGGVRYFSHTPAAPAQVIQNVSQAMRCFMLQGKRTRFDGVDAQGRKKYRTVSALEDETARTMAAVPRVTPGSFVDFRLSPTITAMSPLAAAFPFAAAAAEKSQKTSFANDSESVPTAYAHAAKVQQKRIVAHAAPTSLLADGFLDELSLDIARALKDLSATMGDLRRLSALGDLSVELIQDDNSKGAMTLRVHFPGVDAATVEALCDDVGVTRGLVGQDSRFDVSTGVPVALKFPFAPGCNDAVVTSCYDVYSAAIDLRTRTSPRMLSVRSLEGHELEEEEFILSEAEEAFLMDEFSENPWVSDPEGYGSLSSSAERQAAASDFEGIEGIYRFIAECDRAKHQLRA